jgi:hypothetical protein
VRISRFRSAALLRQWAPSLTAGTSRHFAAAPGPGFTCFRAGDGRRLLYLRGDLALDAALILDRIDQLEGEPHPGAGNRHSGFLIKLEADVQLFFRRAMRGGLMRYVSRDLYIGIRPRALRELKVAAEAWRRRIPVAEPVGGLLESVAPMVYRDAILTRAIAGMTLWDFLRTDDDPHVRAHVFERARQSIDVMHRGGLYHADLNLRNLFVTHAGEDFAVKILDLDKARLYARPLSPSLCRANLRRLLRSARKLDPAGTVLDAKALAVLTAG